VHQFTMYTNAGWWLQSCSVNCMSIQNNFLIVRPYKLWTIFSQIKTYS